MPPRTRSRLLAPYLVPMEAIWPDLRPELFSVQAEHYLLTCEGEQAFQTMLVLDWLEMKPDGMRAFSFPPPPTVHILSDIQAGLLRFYFERLLAVAREDECATLLQEDTETQKALQIFIEEYLEASRTGTVWEFLEEDVGPTCFRRLPEHTRDILLRRLRVPRESYESIGARLDLSPKEVYSLERDALQALFVLSMTPDDDGDIEEDGDRDEV